MKYVVAVNGEDHEVVVDGQSIRADAATFTAHLTPVADTPVQLLMIGDQVHRVVVRGRSGRGRYSLWLDGYRFEVEALDERARAIRELAGFATGPTGPAPLLAPMPGMIVRVTVAVGDHVEAGDGLVMMEAMKMENELRATGAGTVKRVLVTPGTAVEKGALLLEME